MYLLGSLQVDVPAEPQNELKLKFKLFPAAPQHALKASVKWYFIGFITIFMNASQKLAYRIWVSGYCFRNPSNSLPRIWLWIIIAALTAAEQPILLSCSTGHAETSAGRHPTGGSPRTTMYFAPLSSSTCHLAQALLVKPYLSESD